MVRLALAVAVLLLATAPLKAEEFSAGAAMGEALIGQMCSFLTRWSDPKGYDKRRSVMFGGFASGRIKLLRHGKLDSRRLTEPEARAVLDAASDEAAESLLYEQAFRMAWVTFRKMGGEPGEDTERDRSIARQMYAVHCTELGAHLDGWARDLKLAPNR